jgi:long-chain acyl-CoA synthetase
MATEPSPHPGRVIARLARHVELAVASLDLTLSQYRVLGTLGDGREAASALAEKLAVSRPSVTGVVDGLVARGLVRRDQVGTDRRRIDIDLTDEGRLVLAGADLEVQRRLTEVAGHLPGGPVAAFEGLDPWSDAMRACHRAAHAPVPAAEEPPVTEPPVTEPPVAEVPPVATEASV